MADSFLMARMQTWYTYKRRIIMNYYCSLLIMALVAAPRLLSGALSSSLPVADVITKDGITWRFSAAVPMGRFVNGDYYVVGVTTVQSVTPAPTDERNGSVLNLPVNQGISGFDRRVTGNRFRADLRTTFPLTMQPGDALISSISIDEIGEYEPWLREGNKEKTVSPVKTVSVLTCLAAPVADDAFRPSYCDRQQTIYCAGALRRDLLTMLVGGEDKPAISEWAERFRRPWLDVCFFGFDAATEYQAVYGREVARSVGIGTLMLLSDYTAAEKEPLLVNLVQYGIDLWGIARAGYGGWQAHGGHGSGRKWPIIFAGMLLEDAAMASPSAQFPDLRFGEDMQTMYGQSWTGANVMYAGHTGIINGTAASTTPGWGPYEHRHPSQWADSNRIGEDYRRCCTSISWVGQALAARIMNAVSLWNHDPFFAYVDRWMLEDDSASVATIRDLRGWDYSQRWARQGQCWDRFVESMWARYRNAHLHGVVPKPHNRTRPGRHPAGLATLPHESIRYYSITGRVVEKSSTTGRGITIVVVGGRYGYKEVGLLR
jgi:hypothetical protein